MTSGSESNILDSRVPKQIQSVIPKNKQSLLNWYGWGYKNSRFSVKNGVIYFEGKGYPLHGYLLPDFTAWVKEKFDITVKEDIMVPKLPEKFPEPVIEEHFKESLTLAGIEYSDRGEDRFIRCHGQTLHDIYYLWQNKYQRIPDLVVWPKSHKDVEVIVSLANDKNVVIIPFGGGTSVSGSVTCPQDEERTIIVLDTLQMNRMLWLDKGNLTVCFEAGIVGQDLERELRNLGLTVGHEPDSCEFSTLGGWVATRASGMKKNVYGNIEDLVVRVKMVTTKGVLQRECSAPRISCGPDFNHLILGSEGTLGVVTEVVLKVRPLPPVRKYGSLVFPDFESGALFMREIAKRRCQPASVRMMDNEQFRFGQSLKVEHSWFTSMMDVIKRAYVTKVKGLNLNKVCAATLLFEGEAEDVRRQENIIYDVANKFNGLPGGSKNGERGYILTFVIAYIRDFALSHEIVAESFETSVPWDRCVSLCKNVKLKVGEECTKHGIKYYLISCRITQTYDAGCCIYFYFGFRYSGLSNPVEIYEQIENSARDEILASGGSISHHHGVGKIRSKWYKQTISETGVALYKAAKRELDPKNIFATSNLLPHQEAKSKL